MSSFVSLRYISFIKTKWHLNLYLLGMLFLCAGPAFAGLVDFEDGTDSEPVANDIIGLEFTTTGTADWIYGDWRSGNYNGPYPDGDYYSNGNFFTWLGESQDNGIITFTSENATYFSVGYSAQTSFVIEAYDDGGTIIASDSGLGNLETSTMDFLLVEAPGIAYIICHDSGNHWLIDDVATDVFTQNCLTNADCDDGRYCNGVETCSAELICERGTSIVCPDNGMYCDGAEVCDEDLDQCVSAGDPCPEDGLWCNGTVSCDETEDQCLSTGDPCPDDGIWCNGTVTCDEDLDQCDSTQAPCPNDGLFCNGEESCDETEDQCLTTGPPCPENTDPCTGTQWCDESVDQCFEEPPLDCNDYNDCTADTCDPVTGCENTNLIVGTSCDDGLFCTNPDSCDGNGTCIGGARDCSHLSDDCHWGECHEGNDTCYASQKPSGTGCDDGLFCTINDQCNESGTCTGPSRDCSFISDQCNWGECDETSDACYPSPKNDGTECNDSIACTHTDECSSGICSGTAYTCDDSDICTDDICDGEGACTFPFNTAPCDDGQFCTVTDYCDGNGVCIGQTRDCSHLSDECHWGECDEAGDTCYMEPKPVGASCNDGYWCTINDQCDASEVCVGQIRDCSYVGDACNWGECDEDADQCATLPKNDGTDCEDGLFCTYNDVCEGGVCQLQVRDCDDGLYCNGTETCNEAANACESSGDPCHAGTCCDDNIDLCRLINVTVLEPQPGQTYPAGADLSISWTTDASCVNHTDLKARFNAAEGSFEVPLAAGASPSGSAVWETPVTHWDDLDITVNALDATGAYVQGTSGAFGLEIVHDADIFYDSSTDETTISWEGGPASVIGMDGGYDPAFPGSWSSPPTAGPWTDADGSPGASRFYRLANAGTMAVGAQTLGRIEVGVRTGFNLLALPLANEMYSNASDVAMDIETQGGVVLSMFKWDASIQSWRTYDPFFPIDDFSVKLGDAFFVNSGANSTWVTCGDVPRERTIGMQLASGYSMAGEPTWQHGMVSDMAAAMMADGLDIREIIKWDTSTGSWIAFDPTFPIYDFPVWPEDGYLLKGGQTASFDLKPLELAVEAISATEAEVSFETDITGVAVIAYGTDPDNLNGLATDTRGALTEDTAHEFVLPDLLTGETYYYEIRFLGQTLKDNGEPYSFEQKF